MISCQEEIIITTYKKLDFRKEYSKLLAMVTERRPEAPLAIHEDMIADMSQRFINYFHAGPKGHVLHVEATSHFLEGFSQHFGKPVVVVLQAVNQTGYGDEAQKHEMRITYEGILASADQWNMMVDVKSGNVIDHLGQESKIEPKVQKIGYGLHRGEDEGQKTTSITIGSVIVDGEIVIPDFNPDYGGHTPFESIMAGMEKMKKDTPRTHQREQE